MQSLLDLNRIFKAHFEKVIATFSPKDGDHVVKSKIPGKKVYGAFLASLPVDVRDRYDWELFRNNFHVFGNMSVVKANLGEGELFHITPVAWPDPSELEEPFASAVIAARKLTLPDHSLSKHSNYEVPSSFGFFVDPDQFKLSLGHVKLIGLANVMLGECVGVYDTTPAMTLNRLSCDEMQLVIDTYVRLYPDFDERQVAMFRKALNEKRLGKGPGRYLRWYCLAVEGSTFFKALCRANPKKEPIKRTFFELDERAHMPDVDPAVRTAVYEEYRKELHALIMKHGGARSLMMRMGDANDIAFGAMHDVHHFTAKPNPDILLKELVLGASGNDDSESTETITFAEFSENAVRGRYGSSSLMVTMVHDGSHVRADRQAIVVPLFPENNGKILEGYRWPHRNVYRGQFELRSIAKISEPYYTLVCRCPLIASEDITFDVKEDFAPYRREIDDLVSKLAICHHDFHTVFTLTTKCRFDVVANNIETGETSKFTVIV
jgi:hypothetical protein